MGLLFVLLLAYTNGARAARKGHSVWLWTIVSFAAFLITSTAGFMLLLACFYKGDLMDRRAVSQFLEQGTLRSVTVVMAGIGGFLAVRFAIDRLRSRIKGNGTGGGQGSF